MSAPDPAAATLTGLLARAARTWPDKHFLLMEEGSATYAEVERAASRLAGALAGLGVGRGTPVVLMMGNSIDQVVCWAALNRLGALHAPLNTSLVGDRMGHALALVRPEVVIADDDLVAAVAPQLERLALSPILIVRGGDPAPDRLALADLLASAEEAPVADVDPLAPATLLFTSGTSGRSKACELSNTYLVRAGQLQATHAVLRHDDVLYCPFPLFHIDCATLTVMAALSIGATAAVAKRFSLSRFWDDVRRYDATVFNFMGATLSLLWKQAPDPRDRDHRVRLAWGVPIPDWQRGFEERFGLPIYQVYGLTDAGVPVYDPQDGSQRTGFAGKVIEEYELRVVDRDLVDVAPGTPGEILVRGREPGLVMNGYYGMPEATEAAFVDGWYRTGDLGALTDDGFLAFLGRLTDSIRRRGENISAFEVEEMVAAHPAVLEVGAIGVPSELTEEDVKVVVALRPGRTATPEELHRFCTETGVRFMVPRYIEIVDALPKTPTEKVEKYRLAEQWRTAGTWDADSGAYLDAGA